MCSFIYEDQDTPSINMDNYVTNVQDGKRDIANKIMATD